MVLAVTDLVDSSDGWRFFSDIADVKWLNVLKECSELEPSIRFLGLLSSLMNWFEKECKNL
jgi:hypothetical protein